MSKPRLIAFYLPQFYPTPENDKWWAKGFTEWTNVGNARPLFHGHYQPRVPADLGYYDLRLPEVREQQATMAREAGIEGFCYWHYWFAGERLLDRVFAEVVESGKPDFPFCLCWANHSWYQKTWDPNKPNRLLIEQTYPGEEDYIAHFNAMLPAFKDKRYMRVDGKLIFGFYAPLDCPDFELFKNTWNRLAQENGLEGFYFFGFTFSVEKIDSIHKAGYDACVYDGVNEIFAHSSLLKRFKKRIFHTPIVTNYATYTQHFLNLLKVTPEDHPCINPNFDHSPRSAERGLILHQSTPKKWGKLCRKIFQLCQYRRFDDNLVFIKAWNEWGEGNYLEPDLKYGKAYLCELKEALQHYPENKIS